MTKEKKQSTSQSPKGKKLVPDKVDGSKIIQSGKSTSISPEQVMANILEKEPELKVKLFEALQTGRFFITVTFQKKYQPTDEHDLHHFWTRRNFMVNDVVPSLKHMASDFIAKENPTAELPDKNQWH